ncbi:hypothetical protein Tco_0032586 [Tanacetum coccineum]
MNSSLATDTSFEIFEIGWNLLHDVPRIVMELLQMTDSTKTSACHRSDSSLSLLNQVLALSDREKGNIKSLKASL